MASTPPPTPPTRTRSFGDVAVAIAKKKKRDQQKQQQQQQAAAAQAAQNKELQEEEEQQVYISPSHRQSSWVYLRDGAILYGLSLGLPALAGILVRISQGYHWRDRLEGLVNHLSNVLCDERHAPWNSWFCPKDDATEATALAPDAEWTDVGVVALLSLSLAFLRLMVVHLLLPRYLTEPQRFQALVRCKSVHLLSSAYPQTLTPRRSLSRSSSFQSEELPPPPLLLDNNNNNNELLIPQLSNNDGDDDDDDDKKKIVSSGVQEQEKKRDDDEEKADDEPARWRTRLMQGLSSIDGAWNTTSSWRRSSRRLLGLEARAPYEKEELKDTDRLFASPRYATAVFRLLYCTASCTCATVWFRSASFWPPAVGGHGRTSQCWDLKGGVALEDLDDTDFDQRNAALRLYFLVQASYHLHSWATHVVSMCVLLWYKRASSLVSMRKSMLSYWRALLQHLLALGLIGGCYLFSSLRRLGVIGIFALDVSSFFIHLLQLCMNAPEDSVLRRPTVITWIHRGLVFPTFVYTRFYVFPFVVWYSAVYESHNWLQQMERTLVPGSANAALVLFHSFLVILTGLNLILVGRLLRHPHLKRVLKERRAPQLRRAPSS